MRFPRRFDPGVAGGMGLVSIVIGLGLLAVSPPRAVGDPLPDEAKPVKPAAPAAATDKADDLVVHEWGTFLGMNGSDGTSLDGMYHEEHALPGFVHGRARDQLRMPMMLLKGETPVIYFYTPRRMQVRVGVDFPQGVWTHWYPQAALVHPAPVQQAESPGRPANGRICWFAEVMPPSSVSPEATQRPAKTAGADSPLPSAASDALWNFAREVDAAFVRTTDGARQPARTEYERFLFYRGLGRARLPLQANAVGGGTLALEADPTLKAGVRHVFILRVENGRGAYAYRPALGPGEEATGVIPSMDESRPLAEFARVIADDLAARLTESGLYAKEARAMVNTWKTSYFHNDGIRVLFVLPQTWTDSFIPMRIWPKPREVVRVMVGRLELLSPERERRAEAALRDLASADPARRLEAFGYLREQGRYVEPIVRRVAATTQDQAVRTLCGRLLLTDFVTELRSAIHNAVDGKRLDTVPLELRAHLARLYRELGMNEAAQAEANAVWQELRRRTMGPNPLAENNPMVLTCRALMYEARGEDRRAAEVFAALLRQQVAAFPKEVRPDTIAWLRNWWVGREYVGCLMRAGLADSTIAALQLKLPRPPKLPENLVEQRTHHLLLAFLLQARGQQGQAEVHWSSMMSWAGLAMSH